MGGGSCENIVVTNCLNENELSFLHLKKSPPQKARSDQRYTYRVLQTIQMKLIPLWVWAERAVLGRAKTALKFKF